MNNTKIKILYFFILIIIGLTLVSIFNYTIDANEIFHPKSKVLTTESIANNEIPFYLKLRKDLKSDTLITGFSEAEIAFRYFESTPFANYIFVDNSYQKMYAVIKQYLKLHKETKKVIIILPCASFFTTTQEYNDDNKINNVKIFFKTLLSLKNTFHNIKYVFSKICFNNFHQKNIYYNELEIFYPYDIPYTHYQYNKKVVEEDNVKKFVYLKNIINDLKENKIDYKIIIPPINTVHLANLKEKGYDIVLENIKKNSVQLFDNVYDFSIINRLTNINTFSEHNHWFNLPDHASYNFGYKMILFLFFREYADNSIYVKLTKDNIDKELKKQKKFLNEFILENKQYVDDYIKNCNEKNLNNKCYRNKENIPFELIKDKNFIHKKIDEKNQEIIFNSLFFSNMLGLRTEKPFLV